jgi:hypothetical protein
MDVREEASMSAKIKETTAIASLRKIPKAGRDQIRKKAMLNLIQNRISVLKKWNLRRVRCTKGRPASNWFEKHATRNRTGKKKSEYNLSMAFSGG